MIVEARGLWHIILTILNFWTLSGCARNITLLNISELDMDLRFIPVLDTNRRIMDYMKNGIF